jgi:hypothetical protein
MKQYYQLSLFDFKSPGYWYNEPITYYYDSQFNHYVITYNKAPKSFTYLTIQQFKYYIKKI